MSLILQIALGSAIGLTAALILITSVCGVVR